jgi:AcrR family transcriptional regulator
MICKTDGKDKAYDKLIEAGIELFGKYGYEAVSIRQITKHAEVNIASVCYYFCSKKQFYEEVVRHLTNEKLIFINKFDINQLEKLSAIDAKLIIANFIRDYQNNFLSEHGLNRLNIFMHEAFLHRVAGAGAMYTNMMKTIQEFFAKIFTIYFHKIGKPPELIAFSIALIHGIIQTYVITNKTIAPSEVRLTHNVLEQSILAILE